jgi:drug/metabolite transporter (DMT)-like permease
LVGPFQTPEAWIWILVGGTLGAAIPTVAFIAGIAMIGPSRAAILMTIEPLVGVTLAALLLGEQPAPVQLIGGACVLVAAAVLQVAPRQSAIPAEAEVGRTV